MNEKNLIPLKERTAEEQREFHVKGGKASGEARRRKKSLQEKMNLLLELPPGDKRDLKRLAKAGIGPEEMDNGQLVVLALFEEAKKGNLSAFREMLELIGEKAADKTEHDVVVRLGKGMKKYAG